MGYLAEQGATVPDGLDQPGPFMKSIKTEMLGKVDPINLDHVYLGSKLHCIYLFPSNDRAYIGFKDRYDLVRDTIVAGSEHLLLLRMYLAYHSSHLVVLIGELNMGSVDVFDLVLLLIKLIE